MTQQPALSRCQKCERLFLKATCIAQPAVLLGIRLLWGSAFFLAGLGKIKNIDRTTEFFTSLQIPMPHAQAIMVGIVEMVGGLLVAIGLGTRLASLALIGAMIGAIHFAENVALFSKSNDDTAVLFRDPGAVIGVTPVSYLAAVCVLLAFGPGAVSIDAIIKKCCGRCTKPGATIENKQS